MTVNDAYGHEAGDRVLQIVARRLEESIDDGLIARLGGDEFVGVLTPATSTRFSASWWTPTVTRVLNAIASPMTIAGRRMSVTGSIGVAVADEPIAIGERNRPSSDVTWPDAPRRFAGRHDAPDAVHSDSDLPF